MLMARRGGLLAVRREIATRRVEGVLGFFRKKIANDMVPIHADNVANNDWIILLESSTVIGPSPERIRVAGWLQEKKIVKKYDMTINARAVSANGLENACWW